MTNSGREQVDLTIDPDTGKSGEERREIIEEKKKRNGRKTRGNQYPNLSVKKGDNLRLGKRICFCGSACRERPQMGFVALIAWRWDF
jgi:hypothetical protein